MSTSQRSLPTLSVQPLTAANLTESSPPPGPRTPIMTIRPAPDGASLYPPADSATLHLAHAKDLEGRCWGPIDIKEFMDDFVPSAPDGEDLKSIDFSEVPPDHNEEAFTSACNTSLKVDFEQYGLLIKNTSQQAYETGAKVKVKPDFAIILEEPDQYSSQESDDDSDEDVDQDSDDDYYAGTNELPDVRAHERDRLLGASILFGELKSSEDYDPFKDFTKTPTPAGKYTESSRSRRTRGQIIKYAHSIMAAGHRSFVLGFVTFGDHARLVLFDNAGILYSASFLWKQSEHLATFFQRMATAEPEERGFDASVCAIHRSDPRVEEARDIFRKAEKSRALPKDVTWQSTFQNVPWRAKAVYSLCNVFDQESKSFHEVLIHKPHVCPERLQGRFTRGYVGVDITEGCVVYMKRSWRVHAPDITPEYDVYLALQKGGVPHLPGCYFGGDVPKDTVALSARALLKAPFEPTDKELAALQTVSATYAKRKGLKCNLSVHSKLPVGSVELQQHTLHVVLMDKVGYPVYGFERTIDLTSAFRDALETHEMANKLGYLHRDISIGNILICNMPGEDGKPDRREGLLIDWDLCIGPKKPPYARRKGRTGTWEFIAARLTQDPHGQVQDVRDDLESFVYVYHYVVLMFCLCVPDEGALRTDLLNAIRSIFSRHGKGDNQAAKAKLDLILGTETTILDALRAATLPEPVQVCLEEICLPFTAIYKPIVDALANSRRPPRGQAPPSIKFAHTPSGIATFPREVQDLVRAGELQCTHSTLWGVFNKVLQPSYVWPDDADPAVAQFPRLILVGGTEQPSERTEMSSGSSSKRGFDDADFEDEEVGETRAERSQREFREMVAAQGR